jgi:SAM-dependent methyltransferase
MDRPHNSAADLEGALDDIRSVNRFLRGSKILVEAVRPFLLGLRDGETLTVLDVGTGGADVPRGLVRCARSLGRGIRVVAVDRDPVTLEYARRASAGMPEVEVRRADAFDLPYPRASFDLVTASMFLHHFAHAEAVRLLAGFRRIARRAVLINDLRRHLVPWAFIGLAARATRRHPMFVHDAPLSVLRGFTVDELRTAAFEAGAASATVSRRLPYRLLLTMPGSDAGA